MEKEKEEKRKIITVTKNYRITIGSMDYQIQKYSKIDPTQAPRFDPTKHERTIRYEWKNEDKYFGLRPEGLEAAIKYIIIQEANNKVNNTSLKEYIDIIKEIKKDIHKTIDNSINIK